MNLLSIIKAKIFLFLEKLSIVDFICESGKVIVNPVDELVVRKVFPFGRLGFTYAMIDFSKYTKIEKRIIVSQKGAQKTQREEIKGFALLKMSCAIGKKTFATTFLLMDRLSAGFVRNLSPIPFFAIGLTYLLSLFSVCIGGNL